MSLGSIDHLVGDAASGSRPRVAVSSCLLGINVRYDGGHRRDRFLTEVLGPYVEWVRVCPEVEIGLGTPRPPIDLHATGDPRRPRLLQGDRDLTDRMRSFAAGRIRELRAREIDGYVLKARSPSCGLRHARLVGQDGVVERAGTGIFAQALKETWPELPMFDETDLDVPHVAVARTEWIFVMHRFRTDVASGPQLGEFHRTRAARIAERDPGAIPELERIVAAAGSDPDGAALSEASSEASYEDGSRNSGSSRSEWIHQYARRLSRAYSSIPAA
ncbi:MAG: DUF523 domain-containing protein [Candidatus Eisenbacteria bacterium]